MKAAIGALVTSGLLAILPARAQLTIEVTVPETGSQEMRVFVAGTFNNWSPDHPEYQLTPGRPGSYTITLPDFVRGPLEFKFTRSSWETVEMNASGGDIPNRTFTVQPTGEAIYRATVESWRDPETRQLRQSTAGPSVSVMDEAFEMPQLGRTRRIWIYLPPDYETSDKRYPVLYMHDGQNVFDEASAFAGEWGVDETLDQLHSEGDWGAIVVAVDHGGERRLDEYSPWVNQQYGGGEGDRYLQFIVETLKPHVDANYRTLPDRLHTGIAGSSLGGLISLYAGLKYPLVFGRAAVFSPALWFVPEIFDYAGDAEPLRPDPRFYVIVGALEASPGDPSATSVRDQRRMIDTLVASGFSVGTEIHSLVHADGTHSEWYWRREFRDAYRWLFEDDRASASD